MILSIGMIVKNEEKLLRKCLEGLQPILNSLHSELIICDTGSTDNTVNIAKEFTDKVYEIEWRGDFADARNTGLLKAKGKWFMFVDADEIFTDTADLIDFFQSGEYKRYKTATYCLRGTGPVPTIFRPLRLSVRDKDTLFGGKIHEQIPARQPIKTLDSIADHYGYDFKTDEERKKKHDRNLPPLLELFEEENPKTVRTIAHIVNEYMGASNYDKVREFLETGVELVGDNKRDMHYHAISYKWANCLLREKKDEEVVDYIRDYFSDLPILFQHTIEKRTIEGDALRRLERYEEAAEAHKEALKLFDKNKKGELRAEISSLIPCREDLLKDRYIHLAAIATSYALADKFDLALEWHKKIDAKDRDNLIGSTAEENYIHLLKLRKLHEDNDAGFDKALDFFLSSDESFNHHYSDVLVYAIERKADIASFLENLKTQNTVAMALSAFNQHDDFLDAFFNYLDEHMEAKLSLKNARVLSEMALIALGLKKGEHYDDDKIRIFETAVQMRNNYLLRIYRDDVYCEEIVASLPEPDAFTYYANQALNYKKDGNTELYLRNLRFALKTNPVVKEVVTILTDRVKEELKEEDAKTGYVAPADNKNLSDAEQLVAEIANLKALLTTLINLGQTDRAGEILKMYQAINPTDPEITFLAKRVEQAKSKV